MDPELRVVYERMFAEEMAVREQLFAKYPAFLATEAPDRSGNRTATALVRRWRREMHVFAFRHRGHYFFPAFQFADGIPKPIIGRLLRLICPFDGWHAMFWFIAANGWLEAGSPVDILDTDPDAVLEAAHHANDEISD